MARILRREKCEAAVVCTGGSEILDFPAAYLASRLIGVPFYAYLLDQYSHMVSYVLGKSFLRRFEPVVMKGAAGVIAPNEFLRDELRRRFRIEPIVIHNACDLSVYESSAAGRLVGDRSSTAGEGVSIVYTGSIGILHFSAFRNLVAAIKLLGRKDVKLHLYTLRQSAELEREGICGPVVYHEHELVSAMPAIQQSADVLFLPLALGSPYPDIVRTAAPGKMGEFLAARRPVLVHAPPDSFISWYFRRHECGLVVDQDDPAQLAKALELLLQDSGPRESIRERAWERAQADFSLPEARAQFARLLRL
jgi:glycosyltransferase involved in cell wall biosynthesis